MPLLKILTINPGSTSTKVAYFEDMDCISSKTLQHSAEDLEQYETVMEQYSFRKQALCAYTEELGLRLEELDAVVGRGGLLRPLPGGTYLIGQPMLEDLKSMKYGVHASNLGAVMAYEIASAFNIPAYVVNPVVVDELEPVARYSGLKGMHRKSIFHALNQKAVAARAAEAMDRRYEEVNLIVAHMGGGITVGAHCKGRVIDVNNGLEEGPFSPERAGSLPILQLLDLCFSGRYKKEEAEKLLVGKGGLVSYFGTSDCREVESRMHGGDKEAGNVLEALAYQVAREIGSMGAVLYGRVDGVVLTGGLAHSQFIVDYIKERVSFLAPVTVYPGEDEMLAMAEGAYKVLKGGEKPLDYGNI